MSRAPRFFTLVAAALLPPVAAHAQGLRGSAGAFTVQHRASFLGEVYEQTGMLLGGEGQLSLGPLAVGLGSFTGSLSGDADSALADRTLYITSVYALIRVGPLAVGPEIEARRSDADAGVTLWRLIGARVRLAPSLGARSVEAVAELSFFPSAQVVDGETISLAFRGSVGVTYALAGPLHLRLAYRFERFDFEASGTAPARLEQYRGAVAGIGLRLGR